MLIQFSGPIRSGRTVPLHRRPEGPGPLLLGPSELVRSADDDAARGRDEPALPL
jgi:hypothetical protein